MVECMVTVLLPVLTAALVFTKKNKAPDWVAFGGIIATIFSVVSLMWRPCKLEIVFSDTLSLLLEPDRLSLFFLMLISCGFLLAILYAREYLAGDIQRRKFYGFSLLTLGAMMGLAQAGNMVTFYMFYEMMSLASFPLVLYSGGEKARRAAMSYLGFSVFGACMALMGMLLGGAPMLLPFREGRGLTALTGTLQVSFFLMALGFSCKAGMMPLANWLPTAHPVAPAPASALLSGIITKAGILGMIRAAYYVFGAELLQGTLAQKVLLALSIVTIFSGSMLAFKENLLKKRLAYSSVSQLSYVIFGIMLLTPEGLTGGLMQVLFHACAKVGLFLCAGAFIHHCKCHYVNELTGMGRRMPVVMAAFTCFSLSLIGIPPFGGFMSKWVLASAALDLGTGLSQLGVIVLMVSALLTAGYLLPIVARGYFPGEGYTCKKTDAGWSMAVPLLILAAAAAILGMFPDGIMDFFGAISRSFL